MKAAILLSKPTIELDPFVARVDFAKCTGCNDCLGECEYKGALETFEENGRPLVRVNPALCSGCGACVAVCEPLKFASLSTGTKPPTPLFTYHCQVTSVPSAEASKTAS